MPNYTILTRESLKRLLKDFRKISDKRNLTHNELSDLRQLASVMSTHDIHYRGKPGDKMLNDSDKKWLSEMFDIRVF